MQRHLIAALALIAATTTTGCNKDGPADGDPAYAIDARLARFASCGELRGYVSDAYLEMLVQSRYGGMRGFPEAGAGDDMADGAGDGPSDHSETNVQEAGVDEPDIVKTDGTFVYVANARGELTIVKSWPVADSAVVGRLPVAGSPYGMFLKDDRVVLFSYVYGRDGSGAGSDKPGGGVDEGVEGSFRHGYATRISVIDVSDRAAPSTLREIDIEGWFVNARRIDDDVYAVLSTWADMPWDLWSLAWDDTLGLPELDWDAPEPQQAAARAEARALLRPHVSAAVDALQLGQILPRAFDHLPGQTVAGEPLLGCTDVYRPEGISRPSMLSVVHLGLDEGDGSGLSATGLMSDGWTVYASADNLYVAQTSWNWWWGWGALDDLNTHVHKFSLGGADTRYEASGAVPGWMLNQFSMSEHDGHLRVATTDMDWWWGAGDQDGANNVFVLAQDGADLDTVGEVRGIAPGERIYAARFQGDRGYLVTFLQVDPLFTLDLSDPYAPRVVGELKIPGFSSYLHPLGGDHVLAIGMDGDDDGAIHGLAISLFDVSDFAKPTLQDQITFQTGWSWSEALYDHRAFTLHRGVLSIPFYSYDYDANSGWWDGFSGMLSVEVDAEQGLAEIGRVDHRDLVAASECLYSWYGDCADHYWYASMRRSVVIEDNLFSISDYGIKVTDLHDPGVEHARVLFWPR